tara:strand:- start:275 stop:643 length:369 start_codon:yes stop_codon:yes gene_type:complete
MKNFLFCLLFFPLFGFASFPIKLDFQSSDTIIRNGKIYVDVGVDSLSKYPVEKETLTEYRARLKKQLNQQNSNNNTLSSKTSVNWTTVIMFWLILGALFAFMILRWISNTFSGSDNSNGYLW